MRLLRKRVGDPLLALLKQGLTPEKMAASVALGAGIAVLPILGITTILCVFLAWAFGLNQAAVQVANYAAYPLQFILLIPFIRMGEWLFRAPRLPLDSSQIVNLVKADIWGAVGLLWQSTWHGVVAWALVVPLAAVILGFCLVPIFRRVLPKQA